MELNPENNIQTTTEQTQDIGFKICSCEKNPGGPCGCLPVQSTQSADTVKKSCCRSKSKSSLCSGGMHKLDVFDWLYDLPEAQKSTQMVEVQFKNTRKGYYLNSNNLELNKGDMVAVEALPGHDIGEVTLTGKLVLLQMKKINFRTPNGETRRVYRIAKQSDLEKAAAARDLEHDTMLRAREIAEDLKLQMKISDVEYQGDGNKAIFYYIADERVDFRQLIKVYAEQFRVKIEMKQIGARQEAGRVGGIGPCGRELCCSGNISSFVSVSTSAARHQDISLNPLKLAGQCGKLKCCLNYEVDTYVEAQRTLPQRDILLETKDATYYHFKTDILSGRMTYSTDKYFAANLVTVDKDRVWEIIKMNKRGHNPLTLVDETNVQEEKPTSVDLLQNESITRFDNIRSNNKKRNRRPQGQGDDLEENNRGNREKRENRDHRNPPNRRNPEGRNLSPRNNSENRAPVAGTQNENSRNSENERTNNNRHRPHRRNNPNRNNNVGNNGNEKNPDTQVD